MTDANEYWSRLTNRALVEVYAAPITSEYGFKAMQIAIKNAWEPPKGYTLYGFHPEQGGRMGVVRRLWDQGRDDEEVRKGGVERDTPTIRIDSAALDAAFLDLWAQGTQIAVPLVDAKQDSGNDGVDYTVAFYQYRWGGASSESRLKFWWDGPAEWQPFVTWFKQVLAAFDRALDVTAPPRPNRGRFLTLR